MRRVYGRRSAECFFNPARCQSRRSDRGSTPLRSRHHHAHTRWNDFAAAVVMRAVPRRCLTDDLGEARAERPERSTADGDTGIGNGHSLPEKGLGALDATRHQIAVRGLAIGRTELAREVCGRHERRTRHRRDIERLCVLAVDEVACPTQMGQVGQFLRRHADNGMRRRRARTRFRRPRLRMLCSVQTQVGDPFAAGRRLRVLGAAIVAGLTAAVLGLFEGFVGFTSVTPGASLATTCALVATMGLIALTLGWALLRRQRHSVPVRVFVVGTVLFGERSISALAPRARQQGPLAGGAASTASTGQPYRWRCRLAPSRARQRDLPGWRTHVANCAPRRLGSPPHQGGRMRGTAQPGARHCVTSSPDTACRETVARRPTRGTLASSTVMVESAPCSPSPTHARMGAPG